MKERLFRFINMTGLSKTLLNNVVRKV